MDLSTLRRLLLDLLGPAQHVSPERLEVLGDEDWEVVAAMASEHRLAPLLDARWRGDAAIPAQIAMAWKEARRTSAINALAMKADLAVCIETLENRGFAPIALKGAYLAWHVYSEAALRPLRDVDILLPRDEVIAAFELLLSAGYRIVDGNPEDIHTILQIDHHLPPLASPRGVVVELHHGLWRADGAEDHAMPPAALDAMRARALRIDGISYLAPEDLFAHLIVHALYSHRLDCGPLVLTDLALLVESGAIDVPGFLRRATEEGWARAANLMLALVAHYYGTCGGRIPDECRAALPDGAIDAASDLMLQSFDSRASSRFYAGVMKAGPRYLLRRILARRKVADGRSIREPIGRDGGMVNRLLHRSVDVLSDLRANDARHQAGNMTRLSRWLDQRD